MQIMGAMPCGTPLVRTATFYHSLALWSLISIARGVRLRAGPA